jgi:hypothetical protein
MIQSVDNSSAQASSASSKSAKTHADGGTSFASALASAQSGSNGLGTSASHGTITGDLRTDLLPPKGETWGPVPGHADYADILSGPRDGFYVSLSGPRKGQAFVITHSHGKTFHVYGEGRNKITVPVPTDPASLKPPKGETWTAVANHHDYKRIEGGNRADQYVNLSGNQRTGESFKIEHHGGKTWHVYAGGRKVAVGGHHKPASGSTA